MTEIRKTNKNDTEKENRTTFDSRSEPTIWRRQAVNEQISNCSHHLNNQLENQTRMIQGMTQVLSTSFPATASSSAMFATYHTLFGKFLSDLYIQQSNWPDINFGAFNKIKTSCSSRVVSRSGGGGGGPYVIR